MNDVTKFLLDSGDPNEYRKTAEFAHRNGSELWGSTTNPTLIAKKLAGKRVRREEAFRLQKEITLEILSIVPGAVSSEVYADETTSSDEMIEQGRDIASWHERIFVKLPTTIEGFKARTALRRLGISVNNTLVFSQQQIFAICLHEELMQKAYSAKKTLWPPFISPFVGRLDDIGENGLDLVENGMHIKEQFSTTLWMLEASVRSISHIKQGIALRSELITAPAKLYQEWFSLTNEQKQSIPTGVSSTLREIPLWTPKEEIRSINSLEAFQKALEGNSIDIRHDLTEKGIRKFADDWKAIITA